MKRFLFRVFIALLCWPLLAFGPNYIGANCHTVWAFVCGMIAGAAIVLSAYNWALRSKMQPNKSLNSDVANVARCEMCGEKIGSCVDWCPNKNRNAG